MNTSEIQNKLAELDGWSRVDNGYGLLWYHATGAVNVPNYLEDFSALHSLQQRLGLHDKTNVTLRVKWINSLRSIVGKLCPKNAAGVTLISDVDLLTATAEQHCEAILKTFEKAE